MFCEQTPSRLLLPWPGSLCDLFGTSTVDDGHREAGRDCCSSVPAGSNEEKTITLNFIGPAQPTSGSCQKPSSLLSEPSMDVDVVPHFLSLTSFLLIRLGIHPPFNFLCLDARNDLLYLLHLHHTLFIPGFLS